MEQQDILARCAQAAEQFNCHEKRTDGSQVAGCLTDGLAILRTSIYCRAHQDVERVVGKDSMLVPVCETKVEQRAAEEIEVYQIGESAVAARQYSYIDRPDEWYLEWLARLRLGQRGLAVELVRRARGYVLADADHRRLAFMRVLGHVLPESARAPLVLFRLMPFAIHIASVCRKMRFELEFVEDCAKILLED